MQLILSKDIANRAQKRQTCLSDYAEMPRILYKDTANRAQKRQTCLNDYAEMQLILYKDTANRVQKRQTCLSDYAKVPFIFYKDNEFYCQRLPYRGEIRTFVKQQKPSNAFKRHHTGL